MHCLRCGRETQDDHVFCDSCLNSMEKYPVRPGTAVILPRRKDNTPKKVKRHAAPSPQDQIKKLKKQRKRLWTTVVCLILILSLALSAVAYLLLHKEEKLGQNYVVAESTAAED